MAKLDADVIVVGGGNAAFCAALAAQEQGASVLMLEAAPEDESGGNSRFTAGSVRVVYNGVDDIKALVPDLTEQEIATTDFGTYTAGAIFRRHGAGDAEPRRSGSGRAPGHQKLRYVLLDARQGRALHPDLRPPGLQDRRQVQVLGRADGRGGRRRPGPRQDADRGRDQARHRDPLRDARARALSIDGVRVEGVRIRHQGVESELRSKSVVLACGGFEANSEWRTRYLGPGWDLAKVRGTRFNTGDGIRMALDIGASPCGNWSGCHAVQWEMNAPEFGDLAVGDQFQKHSYPFCRSGQRHRQALRRRRRRLPQLHLCQIRPRGAGAARPVRLADLRPEGEAPAARRVQDPADHQGRRPTRSRNSRTSSKA